MKYLFIYACVFLQENNEIFSLGHGERILQKIKSYLPHHMYANCLSNIAKNTSKSLGNIHILRNHFYEEAVSKVPRMSKNAQKYSKMPKKIKNVLKCPKMFRKAQQMSNNCSKDDQKVNKNVLK